VVARAAPRAIRAQRATREFRVIPARGPRETQVSKAIRDLLATQAPRAIRALVLKGTPALLAQPVILEAKAIPGCKATPGLA
jgi:hypothetical protein